MSSHPSRPGARPEPVAKMLERVTVDRDCLPAGSPVGSFVLHEVLERDDFGVFYRAGSSASDSIVVIEEYWPQALAQRDADGALVVRDGASQPWFAAGLAAFIEETEQLAQPCHKSLVTLGPVWRVRNTAYRLRIEQAGEMLGTHLDARERPPDERWLRAMAEPLLGALACVHGLGRLHGNVRPGNIVLQSDGQPVLLEFGAARAAVARAAPWLAAPIEPDFAAPELQLYAVTPTPAADLYSLAAVLVFCMVGEVPAPARATPRRSGTGRLAPLLEELQRRHPALRYSDTWIDTLERALAFEPESRPQSVEAFRQELARPPAVRPPPVVAPPSFRAPAPVVTAPTVRPAPVVAPPVARTPPAFKPPPGPFNGPTLMPEPETLRDAREPTWQVPQPAVAPDLLLHVPIQHDPPSPRREGPSSASMPLEADPPPLSVSHAFTTGPGRLEPDAWTPRRKPIIRRTRRWPWVVAGALGGAAAMFAIAVGVGELADDARLAQVLTTAPSALGDLLPSIGSDGGSGSQTPSAPAPPGATPAPAVVGAGAAPTAATAAAASAAAAPAAPQRSATAVAPVVANSPARAQPAPLPPRAAAEPPARAVAARAPAAAPVVTDPAGSCAPRTNFALYLCMKRQCEQTQLYAHPQCVQLRRDDEP